MSNAQPCAAAGHVFRSQKEAAAHFGVSPAAVSWHLNRHGHLERLAGDAPPIPKKSGFKPKKTFVLGIPFKSRREAAAELGIADRTLRKYLSGEASEALKKRIAVASMAVRKRRANW
ncbi:NUMOD1 domain-containing DNA-binding protein [Pseudooceanicola nitratireducens]|uniref:NUMOD1 domain-containing DNA-binding protein n=1 Tax=Pseudooceanicola nitratireducens TaxID=517719 RepID=UPI003C7BB6BB